MSQLWSPGDAAGRIAIPRAHDDKYSRGVLGVVTGSRRYPGAAVIGVESALRTGVGMVRHLAPSAVSELVLARRPEVVTTDGRVQAWLLGSGMDAADRGPATRKRLERALGQDVPTILDGGALDLHARATGPVIITPHYRELARTTGLELSVIAADPQAAAVATAGRLGVTVVLKGHSTWVASPSGSVLEARCAPPWLATAGAGDALAGILGALVATHAGIVSEDPDELARLGATAAVIHGLAAERASNGGPFTIMDLAAALPGVIADLVRDAG